MQVQSLTPNGFFGHALPPQQSSASSSSAAEIVRLEQRWITAILNGLATIKKEPFTITLSDQTADFDSTGDAVVLHGLDTITQYRHRKTLSSRGEVGLEEIRSLHRDAVDDLR